MKCELHFLHVMQMMSALGLLPVPHSDNIRGCFVGNGVVSSSIHFSHEYRPVCFGYEELVLIFISHQPVEVHADMNCFTTYHCVNHFSALGENFVVIQFFRVITNAAMLPSFPPTFRYYGFTNFVIFPTFYVFVIVKVL